MATSIPAQQSIASCNAQTLGGARCTRGHPLHNARPYRRIRTALRAHEVFHSRASWATAELQTRYSRAQQAPAHHLDVFHTAAHTSLLLNSS